MALSRCPSCGATVQVAYDPDAGEPVPLEIHTDASSDAPRYRMIGFDPMRAERVPDGASGDFYPDHRADCPGHGNGL